MPPAHVGAWRCHQLGVLGVVIARRWPLCCAGRCWRYQASGSELVVPDNIVLLHLPPYSPELNPMENVWDYLHQNKLCALVWDNYDDIIDACKTAWNWLIADPARITSIGTREWACVSL